MKLNSKPVIYGLIGYPVRHSLSPLMHNAAFDTLKMDTEYRLFELAPQNLEAFLLEDIQINDARGECFSSQAISGFNVTIPHKVRAYEILKNHLYRNITVREYPYAVFSGAINTVKREDKKFEFENTDAKGFSRSLEEDLKFDFRDKNILVFGCGGAGRAVIAGLTAGLAGLEKSDKCARKIYIYDTNQDAIKSAKTHFKFFKAVENRLEFISSAGELADTIRDTHLLVNASPVGMRETDPSIISRDSLHNGLYVYDLVYNRETQLIKDAQKIGLNAVNGLGMLLYQGAAAFKLWTNEEAPIEPMRQALIEGLRKCQSK